MDISLQRHEWVALAILVLFAFGVVQPSVNDLPGVSDHTGPTEMSVTEFERLDSGCADTVADYASSGLGPNGTHERTTFVETGDPDADLSVSTVRTSPPGADLSTFRVHVESHGDDVVTAATANESCRLGVQYRLVVQTSGGSPEGFLPDAHGHRIRWLENGEYAGCSGSVTSPLESGCERFREPPERTWANATAT